SDDSLSGFIRFEVDKVSTLGTGRRYSPEVEVRGIPWKLSVFKKSDLSSIGVSLDHGKSNSNIWSIDVSAELSLINTSDKGNPRTMDFKTTFNNKTLNWGFYEYISWEEVVNEKKGFIKDDKITLEVRFTLSNI
ncbi:hypothetical protein PMAYCL1PPCAC_24947, partial [Pristionchus mayeri]